MNLHNDMIFLEEFLQYFLHEISVDSLVNQKSECQLCYFCKLNHLPLLYYLVVIWNHISVSVVPGLFISLPVIRGPPVLVMLNLSFSVGLFFDLFERPISACVLYTDILSRHTRC